MGMRRTMICVDRGWEAAMTTARWRPSRRPAGRQCATRSGWSRHRSPSTAWQMWSTSRRHRVVTRLQTMPRDKSCLQLSPTDRGLLHRSDSLHSQRKQQLTVRINAGKILLIATALMFKYKSTANRSGRSWMHALTHAQLD